MKRQKTILNSSSPHMENGGKKEKDKVLENLRKVLGSMFQIIFEFDVLSIYEHNCMSHYEQNKSLYRDTFSLSLMLLRFHSERWVTNFCNYLSKAAIIYYLSSLTLCMNACNLPLCCACRRWHFCVCVCWCTLKSETKQCLERKKARRGIERKEQRDYYMLGINEGH